MSSGMPLEMGFNIFLLLLLYFLLFIVQNIVYIVSFLHFFFPRQFYCLNSFIIYSIFHTWTNSERLETKKSILDTISYFVFVFSFLLIVNVFFFLVFIFLISFPTNILILPFPSYIVLLLFLFGLTDYLLRLYSCFSLLSFCCLSLYLLPLISAALLNSFRCFFFHVCIPGFFSFPFEYCEMFNRFYFSHTPFPFPSFPFLDFFFLLYVVVGLSSAFFM
jgi:hypothetical protein